MSDGRGSRDAARADLCRFLAACFYEPEPAFAEEHLFDSIAEAAARIDPALAAHAHRMREDFATQALQALRVDYTRLFLGPARPLAAPYGSFWLTQDPGLMQDSTLGVLEAYREAGFDVDDAIRDLPDHVALELEFLYVLIFRANAAAEAPAGAPSAVELKQRFLDRHLGAWIGPFTAAVEAGARCDFYRELAALTRRFVRMESAASSS